MAKILYRGQQKAIDDYMLPVRMRDEHFVSIMPYPDLTRSNFYPEGATTEMIRAAFDHRSGGARFAGDGHFPGSPFIALTDTESYAREWGCIVYKVSIPMEYWEVNGIDDVATFLKQQYGGYDPAPSMGGPSTEAVEALYKGPIPSSWCIQI